MNLIDQIIDFLFSIYFYMVIWIILVILTFVILRKFLRQLKHEKMVKNSYNLVQSENFSVSISDVEFFLQHGSQFLDKKFIKGPTSLKEEFPPNTPLFNRVLILTNYKMIRRKYVVALAKEMRQIFDQNPLLRDLVDEDLQSFLDHPEEWYNGILSHILETTERKSQIKQVRSALLQIIAQFLEIVKISELKSNYPLKQM